MQKNRKKILRTILITTFFITIGVSIIYFLLGIRPVSSEYLKRKYHGVVTEIKEGSKGCDWVRFKDTLFQLDEPDVIIKDYY
jgi:hypothetical protein